MRTTGQNATLACLLEVAAPKVGNVHRGADFEDLTFYDFLAAAVAIAPAMQHARETGVGEAVLNAIQATQAMVQTNANLGIALLLAPLAACDPAQPLRRDAVGKVLDGLTPDDARDVYRAIQLAAPGGMGTVKEMDVAGQAPPRLLDAMNAAAPRDLVALQYATRFECVFDEIVPLLQEECDARGMIGGIVNTQLRCLAQRPDTLIQRKCGEAVALEVQRRARHVVDSNLSAEQSEGLISDFDFWLRCDGHKRNPGATADLIAAGLFVALRDDLLKWDAATGR